MDAIALYMHPVYYHTKFVLNLRWFFSMLNGIQAENLLSTDPNQHGSYIVRHSPNGYSLSVRDGNKVIHYRIKHFDKEFFITKQVKFKSIMDLVVHYRQQAGVLCVNLKHPYVPSTQPNTTGASKHVSVKWEINHKQIQLIKKIRTDRLGDIWEGLWNGSIPVTIKSLRPGCMPPSEFLKEAELMKPLQHPHVVRLLAVCTSEPVYIITEYMKHGSLLEYLCKEGQTLTCPQLINMASQVAAGMAYITKLNIVHRDLAARNILVGDNMNCKVSGFRFARLIEGEVYEAPPGTKVPIKWTAPEAALSKKFSTKSDVWSFGIVLCEIITHGSLPYPGLTNAQVLVCVQQGYHMPRPTGCPDKLYKIICACWSENPTDRPSFESLQQMLFELKLEEDAANISLGLSASLCSSCKLNV